MRLRPQTKTTLCALLAPGLLFGATDSAAAPGDLDTDFAGFGTGGIIQKLENGSTMLDMTLDAEGRLITTGVRDNKLRVQRRSGPRFATAETLDVVFDAAEIRSVGVDVAVAPDGKIVVAAAVVLAGNDVKVGVARLNADFTLDSGFAVDGTTISTFAGTTDDTPNAVLVQADKKVVVVGYYDHFNATGVLRFNEDGTPDVGFDGDGKVVITEGDAYATCALIQPDQKIVVAGGYSNDDLDFLVARLDTDGTLDDGFDDDGIVTIGFGDFESADAVALGPNGEIVVVGGASNPRSHMARLLSTGDLDDTLDEDGKLSEDTFDGYAPDVVVQPDGRIVVATGGFANGDDDRFLLTRYDFDGTRDKSFGTGGDVVTTLLFAGSRSASLALQPDGMLVVTGETPAARYRADGSLDVGGIASVGFDPRQTGSEVTALALQDSLTLVAAGKTYVADYDMSLARFTLAGIHGLDVTFGNGSGRVIAPTSAQSEEIRSLAFYGGNQPVVAGQLFDTSTKFFVARFQEDGVVATECGGFGIVTVDFGGADASAAAAYVRPLDTRIYAAGTARGTNEDYALVRLTDTCEVDQVGGPTPDLYKLRIDVSGGDDFGAGLVVQDFGSVVAGTSAGNIVLMRETVSNLGLLVLDTGFGTNGYATLDTGYTETAAALTEQLSDGALVVAGTVDRGGTSDFVVARLNLHGAIDSDFGANGFAFADFNTIDTAHAVAARSDGAIAVAGCTTTQSGVEFAVAQFTPEGDLDTAFSGDGKTTLKIGFDGQDCAQAVAYTGFQRLVAGGYATFAGRRQFTLAAFETTPNVLVTTTTITTTTTTVSTTSTTTTSSTTTTLPAGDCGDPNGDEQTSASDALIVLRTAVGLDTCELCVCDADDSGNVTASDALRVLRVAVGQSVTLDCPATCT